jgi:hypothetical protein
MNRLDELLSHAKSKVHTTEVPFNLHPAAAQRRLRRQFVTVIVVCSAVLVALGMPSGDISTSVSPSLGQPQIFALLEEGQGK